MFIGTLCSRSRPKLLYNKNNNRKILIISSFAVSGRNENKLSFVYVCQKLQYTSQWSKHRENSRFFRRGILLIFISNRFFQSFIARFLKIINLLQKIKSLLSFQTKTILIFFFSGFALNFVCKSTHSDSMLYCVSYLYLCKIVYHGVVYSVLYVIVL